MKLQVSYPSILAVSLVAGIFSLTVALLLLANFAQRGTYELFDNPKYVELKQQLAENPGDERIEEQIRDLDRQLRESYFNHRRFMARGVYLLIGGALLTLVTARWAASLRPRTPHPTLPDESADPLSREHRWGRRGAAAVVAAVAALMCGLALRADRILPRSLNELEQVAARTSRDQDTPPEPAAKKTQGTDPAAKTPAAAALPTY